MSSKLTDEQIVCVLKASTSEKIMEHIRKHKGKSTEDAASFSNVVSLSRYKNGTNG
jgi:hypothetical protein